MAAHFVITLFNLALWDRDKHLCPTRTRGWLEGRCELFERFCLPSMAAQSGCRLRAWLVFFDSETPADVRDRIEHWRRECPTLSPVFLSAAQVKGFTGHSEGRRVDFIRREIERRLGHDDDLVITTNLDNDDALASDALLRVEQSARPGCVVSLRRGLQYFTQQDALVAMRYPHNHFLSLCEDRNGGELQTIESMSHRVARKRYEVVDLDGEPGWLEVVHGGNVSNELRITSRIGYRLLWGTQTLSRFGIDRSLSAAEMRRGNMRLIRLFGRVAVWRLRRKIFGKD